MAVMVETSAEELKFANTIAKACFLKYSGLSKTGKPNSSSEWTLLSAVVKVDGFAKNAYLTNDSSCEVVALGTGSKCIGKNAMSPDGDVLNDSHAEVMARRGFLRYLYHQVDQISKTGFSDIFKTIVGGKCLLKDNITFHFFTSHTPCGDGSIFQKTLDSNDFGECLELNNINSNPKVENKCSLTVDAKDSEFILCEDKTDTFCEKLQEELKNSVNNLHSDSEMKGLIFKKAIDSNINNEQSYFDQSDLADVNTFYSEVASSGYNSKCFNEFKVKGVMSESVPCISGIKRHSEMEQSPSKRRANCAGIGIDREISSNKDNQTNTLNIEPSKGCVVQCDERVIQNIDQSEKMVKHSEEMLHDVHRTGAKCVLNEMQDKREHGIGYHVVGVLRTKPGRGDPTLSLSCSDKLARWHAVGTQGALLSLLLEEPIYFKSLIVGGGCPFSREALSRAVVQRLSPRFCDNTRPLPIIQSSVAFVDGRPVDEGKRPCASSVVWCNVIDRPLEVAVKGRKQGVTMKVLKTPAGRLKICKRELAMQFINVITSSPNVGLELSLEFIDDASLKAKSYKHLKHLAENYQQAWQTVRTSCFPAWPDKPEFLVNFTADL